MRQGPGAGHADAGHRFGHLLCAGRHHHLGRQQRSLQTRAQVAFDGRQLLIGPHKYAPAAAANEESLSVDDGNGDIAYTFGAGSEMVIVSRHAGGKQLHFQVTPVNEPMAIYACDTE